MPKANHIRFARFLVAFIAGPFFKAPDLGTGPDGRSLCKRPKTAAIKSENSET